MRIKQSFHWLLIFSLLSCFSLYAVNGESLSLEIAVAKAIAAEPSLAGDNALVLIEASGKARDKHFDAFLDNLTELQVQKRICGLTAGQYRRISSRYRTSTEIISVNGKDVTVVQIRGNKANKRRLEALLGNSQDTRCRALDVHRFLYVLFSPHVS